MECHFLHVMKIVHHHTNGRFDWLIPEQQSVNSWRDTILLLAGKCKRFTVVRPVSSSTPNYSNKKNYTTRCPKEEKSLKTDCSVLRPDKAAAIFHII